MERLDYFVKRLLLVIPTFLGITFVVFTLCQFVPGGPIEQMLAQLKAGAGGEGGSGSEARAALSEELRQELRAEFGFDKPLLTRYWDWLWHKRAGLLMESYKWRGQPSWEVIVSRFRVSLIFGVTGFVLTYVICIPLGIAKALRDGSTFDVASSVVVFTGYAIPAFAFGMLLKMFFSGTSDDLFGLFASLDWFPVSGFESEHFATLSAWSQFKDRVHHMFLPLLCYMISSFAVLTLLMKNSLLEQVSQDYVRTVLAQGASMRHAIWGHAVRNALIPIATGIGGILTVFFAGSVLIESVFEIPGMGKLSLDAIVSRDYAVFMGILSLTSILGLIGNIITDMTYVLIDPRINFASR
jgi:microcin C transport system permease protein